MSIIELKNKKIIKTNNQIGKPQYGIVTIPIDFQDKLLLEKEISLVKSKLTTKAKTNSDQTNELRRVSNMWRIDANTFIGKYFKDIAIECNNVFNYKISQIQDLQYLEYEKDDFYGWHYDIDNNIASKKKISISVLLNDDYEGGDLKINVNGEVNSTKEILNIKEKGGAVAICFPSFMIHQVEKVTGGKRCCIVGWVGGESWK